MELRDYQQEIYDKIRIELRTHNGVCAVLPCRSGKSYIMNKIVENTYEKGNTVLILAHRNILLNQHKKLIKKSRIASVFKEARNLGKYEKPDLIIIDEAHISGAESYKKVCDYYKCKRILFTATAKRLDNKPLSLADVIINGVSADELIERGYIASYDYYAPKLNININSVKMAGSDFDNKQLGDIMCDKKIYGDIIKYYKELAFDKQSIAYCTNIRHSLSVCELFNENNITAKHIDATTSEKEREKTMQEFKDGKFKILCNCNLISEGITLQDCDACLLLRPTQSETLFIQQASRCLTPRENKKAVIIDYVGNVFAHGMPTEKRIYTLKTVEKIKNASREPDILARSCSNCFRTYSGVNPVCPYCAYNNGKTKKQMEQDKQAELERITKINKTADKLELKEANKSLAALKEYGKKKGYDSYWAIKRWQILQKYRK